MNDRTATVLRTLYIRYGDFYLQRLGADKALWSEWKWYSELGDTARPTDRQILDNEIVIDFDYEQDDRITNIRRNLMFSSRIRTRLKDRDIAYSEWRSGGKGVHLHIFLKEAEAELLSSVGELQGFKKWFIETISAPLPEMGVVDMATTKSRSLIQVEYAAHRKGTGQKLKRRGEHISETSLWPYLQDYLRDEASSTINSSQSTPSSSTVSALKNNLITYCMENQVTDCRQRLLFFIANRVIRTEDRSTTQEVLETVNQQFADDGDDRYLSASELTSYLERAATAKQQDIAPPSYEWIWERIRGCSDKQLQDFAEDWIAAHTGDA